jgi:hypothetical protein
MAGTHKTPTYPQYTNLGLSEGVFDRLMIAIRSHLDIEYDGQRIRGDNYSKVYLGSIEAALGNSTQYLLGLLLIDEKQANLIAQTLNVEAETRQTDYETDFILPQQLLKLIAETTLIETQILKILKEIEFLNAKIDTEIANVDGSGVADVSVIGRQMSLLLAQRYGFAGDIQSKVAKLHGDYAAVWQSVQEDETVPDLIAGGETAAEAAMNRALFTAEQIKDDAFIVPPIPPTSLTGEASSSTQIDLTWSENAIDETGYEIERTPTTTGVWILIHTTAAGADSWSDTTVSAATGYDYRIRAIKDGVRSSYSNIVIVTTPA